MMPNIVSQLNVGTLIAAVTGVAPQSSAAATINGSGIDRYAHGMPLSCLLHQAVGADTGAPTSISVQTTLQHSADNATWSNYTDPNTGSVAQTAAATAVNTDTSVAVDLSSANRYIRASTVVSFTGGTSPTVQTAVDVIFGGENPLPSV